MARASQKTVKKVTGRIARHKAVRYHNDAKLFASGNKETKICPACNRPFANRKKWETRGTWPLVIYCSKACRKKGKPAE